jgi:TRAP-type transport system periplasmic protein
MKILFLLLLIFSVKLSASTIKIAAIAPEGSNWANTIRDMSQEIKQATKNKINLKVYYGGVAGDESDVLRKIRVGQLQGGVFTGKTLGDIVGDIRVLEIPFNFYQNREKGFKAMQGMSDYFNKGLEAKGFVNLGFYEIGQVYFVSTKEVETLQAMKGIKIWSWEGDELVKSMIESLQLVSVPLALPDVLSSLSTGIIDAAYAPPLGILALQWQSKVKYLVNFPTAYSVGALLVTQKVWQTLSKEEQQAVKTISQKYVEVANKMAVKDNDDGLELLKKQGIKFVEFNKDDIKKAEEIRTNVINKLKGSLLSDKALKMLDTYR